MSTLCDLVRSGGLWQNMRTEFSSVDENAKNNKTEDEEDEDEDEAERKELSDLHAFMASHHDQAALRTATACLVTGAAKPVELVSLNHVWSFFDLDETILVELVRDIHITPQNIGHSFVLARILGTEFQAHCRRHVPKTPYAQLTTAEFDTINEIFFSARMSRHFGRTLSALDDVLNPADHGCTWFDAFNRYVDQLDFLERFVSVVGQAAADILCVFLREDKVALAGGSLVYFSGHTDAWDAGSDVDIWFSENPEHGASQHVRVPFRRTHRQSSSCMADQSLTPLCPRPRSS